MNKPNKGSLDTFVNILRMVCNPFLNLRLVISYADPFARHWNGAHGWHLQAQSEVRLILDCSSFLSLYLFLKTAYNYSNGCHSQHLDCHKDVDTSVSSQQPTTILRPLHIRALKLPAT